MYVLANDYQVDYFYEFIIQTLASTGADSPGEFFSIHVKQKEEQPFFPRPKWVISVYTCLYKTFFLKPQSDVK